MDTSNLYYGDDFGYSDDDWDDEPLTAEEQAAQDRADRQQAREEIIGEIYNARFSFD
jgi:hypothetical protein